MYKSSIFNVIEYFDDVAMIYNSLYGRVFRINNAKELKDLLNGEINTELHNALFHQLVEDGILVDEKIDEKALSAMKFYDNIYNPTLNLVLLPTEQCNFRCTYCYESFSRGKMTKECQNAIISYLKQNINRYTGVELSWFGGEPLMAMDVIDYISAETIKICHAVGKPFSASVTTNGYFLTLDNINLLRKNRINSYQITIDGPQICHDKTRVLANGKGTYYTIINNLRTIRDGCKSKTFGISIRTNITYEVLPYIDDYIKFLHDEFAGDPRFSFYFRPVGNWGGDKAQDMENVMVNSLSSYYKPIIGSRYVLNTDSYIQLLNAPLCAAAKRNCFIIGTDSSVYKCTMLFDNPENKLGILSDDGRLIIDDDRYAKWIIRDLNKTECGDCFYYPRCNGGTCPAEGHVLKSGDGCGYEKKSIKHILHLIYKDSSSPCTRAKIKIYNYN